jgi:MtN3 and saliva related transmembrane protein
MVPLGLAVAVVDVGQFLPQAHRTFRVRHDRVAVRGLSLWTWTLASLQGLAWIVYGFAEGLLPIAVPNLVITPICLWIVVVRLRHRGDVSGQDEPT